MIEKSIVFVCLMIYSLEYQAPKVTSMNVARVNKLNK